MTDPLVREIGGALDEVLPLDDGGIDFTEHSKASHSKKIISGPLVAAPKTDVSPPIQTVDAIALATGSNVLEPNKAYRLISDGSFLMRQNNAAGVVVGNVYVPPNTAVIVSTRTFKLIAISGETGTFVQAVEVR